MVSESITTTPESRSNAKKILARLPQNNDDLRNKVIAIAGESGSGKSVIAISMKEVLNEKGLQVLVMHQDNYFNYPPQTNHQKRLEDPSQIGPQEVNLNLMQEHLHAIKDHTKPEIEVPQVNYLNDFFFNAAVDISNTDMLIVEGTYCFMLEDMDYKVFIDRNYHQTMPQRISRARDPISDFTEKVLEIEHQIIAPMSADADILVQSDFSVYPD